MTYTIIQYLWIFLNISFAGWIAETFQAAARNKRFVNRGFFFGPFCPVYGISAVMMNIVLKELNNNILFLFIGCMIIGTGVELITARILEYIYGKKWWDYSNLKFNFEGYICLRYSLIWGVLGVLAMKLFIPFSIDLLNIIPGRIQSVIVIIFSIVAAIDFISSCAAAFGIKRKIKAITGINKEISHFTLRLTDKIFDFVDRRVKRAYPHIIVEEDSSQEDIEEKTGKFAEGCGFYKLVILFFVGALLGDLVETIFCYYTTGVIMSRSSVIYGPFSIVWGIAIALATLLLHKYREKSEGYIFVAGTILGGAYEYICSVFTEIVFGVVFWDYSNIPYNLGGRINLLYSFFWGIAAVVWIKLLYPRISIIIELIPVRLGKILTWILIVFMTINIFISVAASERYYQRMEGKMPQNSFEQFLDDTYDDARMKRIYPNAIKKR